MSTALLSDQTYSRLREYYFSDAKFKRRLPVDKYWGFKCDFYIGVRTPNYSIPISELVDLLNQCDAPVDLINSVMQSDKPAGIESTVIESTVIESTVIESTGKESTVIESTGKSDKPQSDTMVTITVPAEDYTEVYSYALSLQYKRMDEGVFIQDLVRGKIESAVARGVIARIGSRYRDKYSSVLWFWDRSYPTSGTPEHMMIIYGLYLGVPRELIPIPENAEVLKIYNDTTMTRNMIALEVTCMGLLNTCSDLAYAVMLDYPGLAKARNSHLYRALTVHLTL